MIMLSIRPSTSMVGVRIGLLSLIFISIWAQGCQPSCLNRKGGAEYKNLTWAGDPGNAELIRDFDAYNIDRQIDVFLYAEGCANDRRFEPILARTGKVIIPDLIRRAGSEHHPADKYPLISVLIRINEECKCIKRDSQEIRELERIGKEMDSDPTLAANDPYKEIYLDSVRSLKEQLDRN